MQLCLYCSGDASAPDHDLHCCGRQGQIEAQLDEQPTVEVVTIVKPRETSVDAFYDAIDSGTIGSGRQLVWFALRALGSGTANEAFEYLKAERFRYDDADAVGAARRLRNISARLTELRDLGLVREAGTRRCRITGKRCIVWSIVPASEYVGEAITHRCPQCGQITTRDVPTLVTK